MKIGVVVDSSCDLPRSFFESNDVELMPATITVGDHSFVDLRDELKTVKFHSDTKTRLKQKADTFAETTPYTSEQIEALFLETLVHKYDHVFCVMATHARSDIYDDVMEASRSILIKHRRVRREAGIEGQFTMTVINSGNILAGVAVLTAELVRMIKAGATPSVIESRINELASHTYCYLVPPDLTHVYKRASRRGDKSISWAGFMLGSMLDIKPILCAHKDNTGPVAKTRHFDAAVETMFANAARSVEAGLLTPSICLAYGGDPDELHHLPGFMRLKTAAGKAGTKLYVTPMGISGAVHTGPGCVSVAFVSDRHVFEEKV
jgi:DegV family protein with EDD domain